MSGIGKETSGRGKRGWNARQKKAPLGEGARGGPREETKNTHSVEGYRLPNTARLVKCLQLHGVENQRRHGCS